MAMFHRTLDSRSMELEPEFSDAFLSPHPIELSESPEAAAGEEAGLWGRDDGEVGEAADAADGTEYSQLVGSPAEHPTASAGHEEEVLVSESTAAPGDGMVGEEAVQAGVVETEPPAGLGAGKRKRGRPPKSQGGRAQVGRPPVKRKEKEEEEVCFICFDGGSLVVCDRRGCPKVYHPACVNRDENFFHSRGRWNCGWHICSICQKSAHYMCYTCTYSLCKGCIREAEFVCIRGSKGFCGTCHRTTMLIESNEVGADFDDENSWEHLFKIYWLDLKRKLSLTREELSTAKNPWKGYGAVTRNENSSDESYNANDDQEVSSDSSSERRVGSNSSKKKVRRRFRNAAADESSVKQVDNERASTTEDTDWASKELLEFVAHMKDGGTPILSQFDVQALLLEYIKQNNLRDPRRKSQIICDLRLKNLFGKARVGHFEMLKLLESHFLLKEASQIVTDDNQEGIVDPDYSQMDAEGYSDAATKITFDKRRKSRKRVEEREPQTNLEDYAAIDIHNINLIYLRRNLMEDLIDDIDKFNEKVVGAFVRIRISGTGQRQDLYRLVQVVGTHTAAEKYKVGKKTTYITLEILNLKKLEVITIDTISNQEFTEEECKRLRQSIKCGLIHPLTVGEVQEKARVLQAVRVSDWLESEKLRLGHLRDRASEKGRRKELRECVEKLQILSTPEERRRRLNEIPEIHTDPNMDPRYESADEGESDGKDQDNYGRLRESFSLRKRREALSSGKGGAIPSNNWNEARRSSNAAWEMNRSTSGDGARDNVELLNTVGDRTNESSWTQGKDVRNSGWGPPSTTSAQAGGWDNNQTAAKPEQSYAAAPETAPMLQPTGISAPSNTSEADKIWHYLDPSGKVQGPFSMTQMRKWSTTGFFPPDLRIWRESERQDEAVFLTGALVGKFQKDPPQRESQHNSFSQSTSFPPSWVDNNQNRVDQWNAGASFPAADSTGLTNAGRLASQSTAWSAPRAELANPMEGRVGLTGWETPRVPNAWPAQLQTYSAPRPTAPFPGNYYQPPPPYQGRGGRGGGNAGRWNQGQDRGGAWNSNRPVGPRPGGPGYERQQPNWSSPGQQSSGEPWKPQPANESRNQWGNDSFNPPSPTPQPSSGGWANVQGAVNTSMSFHRAGPGLGTAPSTAATMEPNKAAANSVGGWGSSAASNAASNQKGKADGWGSWTAASASMPDKAKKAEAVNGWDSWSAASASRPDKTKMAEPVDASTIPERSDALVGSHTSSQQKEPSESDAPAILGNQSTLLWEGMNGSDCSAAMGSPASKKNQFLQDDCPSPTPLSERQDLPIVQSNELDPLAAMEDKLISPATSTKPTAKSESQGWGRASSQEQNGPSLGTPPSENREQNQNQKLNSCNWQGPPDTKSREWSLPSPTPATKPSGWDLGADSTTGQNNPWASSDGSMSASSQPSNPGWGTAPQNPGRGTEAAQGNASTGCGTTLQGNTNKGWEATTQVETPVQPNANPSTGWGMPAQGSNASSGWGTPAQGNSNPNTGWGAPLPQGSMVPSAGWGAPAQVNAVNPSWGGPAPGNSNPNPGWGAPAPMGNTNANGSWGAGQGNPNWGSQQDQNGEWFDRGGQGYRNSRMQSGGGGRSSSRPPPRGQGQRAGVCKFHESGYCKKGSSCNYLHS